MIELRGVTVRYGSTIAVDHVDLDLPTGQIYGLLGRNGSGKTSLLSALASYRRPATGTIRVDGADAFENPAVMRATCFVRDTLDVYTSDRIRGILCMSERLRASWDPDHAAELLDLFGLDPRKRVTALSRGQRSALGVVLGLASRAALTILDEPTLGMDAVARGRFAQALLDDYLAHPRTFILSTHLFDEVADLVERVVILDHGRVLLHAETDELRGRGVTVTGPAEAVGAFTAGHVVLGQQTLGGLRAVTLDGRLDAAERARGETAGLTFGPIGIQDLFVHLTTERELEASR